MNEKYLIEIAEEIEKYISEKLINVYSDIFSDNSDKRIRGILPYLKRLANRSREYKNQSFVVLVVGPVKSGKSTFVNLVANEYVSPTHYLECTGRPSIISKGNSREITIYHSKDTNNKAGQIEDIFDCLNGLIHKNEIADVEIKTVELSEENIKEHVKLDLNSNNEDETLITSITTDTTSGGLLQENVLLIDMAGFDGAKVNMGNTPYEKIVERADVIIFVQSSNSAISKVATEFFDIIKKHNTKAPICLIHNIFDSAYWRPDEHKRTNEDEHIKYAVNQFQSIHHLHIDESMAYNVNLGKVSDLRHNDYQESYVDALKEAECEFIEVEQKIADYFTGRGIIRMQNCITKAHNKLNELMGYVKELNKENILESTNYEQIAIKFEGIKLNEGNTTCIDLDEMRKRLKDDIREEYDIVKYSILDVTYQTQIVRAKADSLIEKIHARLKEYFTSEISSVTKVKDSIIEKCIIKIQEFVLENTDIIGDYKVSYDDIREINICVFEKQFIFSPEIDVEQLFPTRPFFWQGWTQQQINDGMKHIFEYFNGNTVNDINTHIRGYIDRIVIPDMEKKIKEAHGEYMNLLITAIECKIENIKQQVLKQIIPEKNKFDNNQELIANFLKDLDKLNEYIRSCKL